MTRVKAIDAALYAIERTPQALHEILCDLYTAGYESGFDDGYESGFEEGGRHEQENPTVNEPDGD